MSHGGWKKKNESFTLREPGEGQVAPHGAHDHGQEGHEDADVGGLLPGGFARVLQAPVQQEGVVVAHVGCSRRFYQRLSITPDRASFHEYLSLFFCFKFC